MTLDQLQKRKTATVNAVQRSPLSAKLAEMGIYPGIEVSVLFRAPLGGPIAVGINGSTLSLRRHEASLIEVE